MFSLPTLSFLQFFSRIYFLVFVVLLFDTGYSIEDQPGAMNDWDK